MTQAVIGRLRTAEDRVYSQSNPFVVVNDVSTDCVFLSTDGLSCLKISALCACKLLSIILYQKVLRAALWHPCCIALTVHSGIQYNIFRGRDIPSIMI